MKKDIQQENIENSKKSVSRSTSNGMETQIYNQKGKSVGKFELPESIFGLPWNADLVHQVVTAMQANSRTPVAHVKTRGEIRGGGKKPWRQKGTGRARAGSTRSPIWVGGGTVFGPDGKQNYKSSQNKAAHRLALKSALSTKTKNGLVIVDKLEMEKIKTKQFHAILKALKAETKALVVVSEFTLNVLASANNINWVKIVTPDNVSVYDLLNVDAVIVEQEAVKILEEALA